MGPIFIMVSPGDSEVRRDDDLTAITAGSPPPDDITGAGTPALQILLLEF